MMTTAKPDRTLAAAGLILVYASVIGFTDNFVSVIAAEAGLWQFHFSRTVMAMVLLAALVPVMGLRLRPRSWRAVMARSAIHGTAMLIYFGALAFLPVAIVAAGLFTAPIFVLLISGLVYGQHIGPFRIAAVALGFLGVVLVLGPSALSGASLAAVLPVAAGLMYAIGNIATRRWCAFWVPSVWRFSGSCSCRCPRGRRVSCCAGRSGPRAVSCGGPSCRPRARCLGWG